MKRRITTLVLAVLFGLPASAAELDPLDRYDELLARYVTPNGVRYDAWRESAGDVLTLSRIVDTFSKTDPSQLPSDERYALYINLYNATVVQLILERQPRTSIRNLNPGITGFGVFFKDLVSVGGERVSLNKLEKRLRKESGDPRVHFAVNCASRSCPPLAAEAYRAERLDEQLERMTLAFLARPEAVSVEQDEPGLRLRLSKIFKWYAGDFEVSGGVLAFVEQHGSADLAALLRDHRGSTELVFQKYDWSLNGVV